MIDIFDISSSNRGRVESIRKEQSKKRLEERRESFNFGERMDRSVNARGGGRTKEKYGFFKFLTGRESRSLRLRPLIFERGGSGGADIG